MQVSHFVSYLKARGESRCRAGDIELLFKVADMTSPRSRKPLRPSMGKIEKALSSLHRRGSLGPRGEDESYEVA